MPGITNVRSIGSGSAFLPYRLLNLESPDTRKSEQVKKWKKAEGFKKHDPYVFWSGVRVEVDPRSQSWFSS